jgi:hypothetical protein
MLKFKDFPCKGKRDFWSGQFTGQGDEAALNDVNLWLRSKSYTLLNVETIVVGSLQWGIGSSRTLRVWYTE